MCGVLWSVAIDRWNCVHVCLCLSLCGVDPDVSWSRSRTEAAALASKVKALESPHAGFRSGAARSVNVNILPNNQNARLATGGGAKPIPPDKFKSNILKGATCRGRRRVDEIVRAVHRDTRAYCNTNCSAVQ